MTNPEDTAVFGPLPETPSQVEDAPQVEASPEEIRALEEYLTPRQSSENKESKRGFSFYREIVMLVFGVILCTFFGLREIELGHIAMGAFLLFCAVFATAMVVCAFLPDNSSKKVTVTAVDRLRESGELDAAAKDFPHEAQDGSDLLRFGERYLFNRLTHTVHSYAQVMRLEIKQSAVKGTNFLTLAATYADGTTETLLHFDTTPVGYDRAATICQQIQSHNPLVQIG